MLISGLPINNWQPFSLLLVLQMVKKCLSYLLFSCGLLAAGCANITSPTGGKKDTTPPKRLSSTPGDSLTNTRLKKVELEFDEFITLNDASKEVQISPLLTIPPTVTQGLRKVTVKIPDTLLEPNTTYRISFGNAIKDLHEGNAFTGYTYTFSTGSWFDSLQLAGKVLNAANGLADSTGVMVVLYYASDGDSAIISKKPRYVTRADATGSFVFKGLPRRSFNIYALKDPNDNLMYDGEGEMIAFADNKLIPGDTSQQGNITLRLFYQPTDSTIKPDTAVKAGGRFAQTQAKNDVFTWSVNADTSNKNARTFDINKQLIISTSRTATFNYEKINLVYDSNGTEIPVAYTHTASNSKQAILQPAWKENTLYTLKLAKGFSKDSTGTDAMPARFTFRTREDEDYGKITVNLPARYVTATYVLQITNEADTIYQQPITSGSVALSRLRPGKYAFRVIEDRNGNGKWDAGNLFTRLQPELVIPYKDVLTLKAGWDNIIDFDQKAAPPRAGAR